VALHSGARERFTTPDRYHLPSSALDDEEEWRVGAGSRSRCRIAFRRGTNQVSLRLAQGSVIQRHGRVEGSPPAHLLSSRPFTPVRIRSRPCTAQHGTISSNRDPGARPASAVIRSSVASTDLIRWNHQGRQAWATSRRPCGRACTHSRASYASAPAAHQGLGHERLAAPATATCAPCRRLYQVSTLKMGCASTATCSAASRATARCVTTEARTDDRRRFLTVLGATGAPPPRRRRATFTPSPPSTSFPTLVFPPENQVPGSPLLTRPRVANVRRARVARQGARRPGG